MLLHVIFKDDLPDSTSYSLLPITIPLDQILEIKLREVHSMHFYLNKDIKRF